MCGMDIALDVRALARDAEARVKIACALHDQEPTAANEERLSEAVRDWELALEAWSRAVELDARLHGEEPSGGSTTPALSQN